MSSSTQLTDLNDLVKMEGDLRFSRENLTITDGQTIVVGALLEASGSNYVVCTTGASAAAVALEAAAPSGADGIAVGMVRHGIVAYDAIDWGALDAAGKTAAIAALKALGILVRTGPTYTTL